MSSAGEDCRDSVADADLGARSRQKVKDHALPTEQEVEEHNLTHLPYRSWCAHCVRGRGEANPHRRIQRDEVAIPEVHFLLFLSLGRELCWLIVIFKLGATRADPRDIAKMQKLESDRPTSFGGGCAPTPATSGTRDCRLLLKKKKKRDAHMQE